MYKSKIGARAVTLRATAITSKANGPVPCQLWLSRQRPCQLWRTEEQL